MIKVADYIVQFLENLGVDAVFTVTGGGSIFMCEALARSKKIAPCYTHHEQAAAMAAEAYQRTKGVIGVTLVTTGPGGTNALTGVAGSWLDSVPHLIISGQSFLKQTIGDTGVRQLGAQELNVVELARSITKYAFMVRDASTIRYHLEKAVHLAASGRPGPVWLDIPADIQRASIEPETQLGFVPEVAPAAFDADFESGISKLVQLLKQAKRPLIHVGQGVKIAGAEQQFFELVEGYGIPFVTARNANDIVESDYRLFVGRPGTFPQRGANFVVQTCDLYLAIGTRLSLPQTGYNSHDFARNATKAMVDIDRTELDKHSLKIDLKFCSDAKLFLGKLLEKLKRERVSIAVEPWIEQCNQWKRRYAPVTAEFREQKQQVNSYYFIEVLSEVLTKDDVIVTDMGLAYQGTHQAFHVKRGQKLFTNGGLASMGWGLPAAIGACMAQGRKRTICIAGDGGLMMNLQELATVVGNKLPIKIFLLNNCGYLTMRQTQQTGFQGQLFGVSAETGLTFPDFIKIAEANGIPNIKLTSHLNLKQQVEQIVQSEGPFFCELMIDQDQPQVPKALNRRNPDGSLSPTPLEDLYPFLDKEEIERNLAVAK